jgi:dihydrofolate synthase / folylpolyglutamate synthase
MDYNETIHFLFNQFPMFEKTGGDAYNPGLERIESLCNYFGNPHKQFRSVHIAGTNGKGSSSHVLAAVLQSAGYKTGLYTSPHLKEFTERIRINGVEISKEEITGFINQHFDFFVSFKASFFEITTLMAFYYFAKEKVDIAIIETGLGGRLDATNIIQPESVLITNIGFDHMQYLGNTLEKIAREKAGIIKERVPVVISEKQKEISSVFETIAKEKYASLCYAQDFCTLENIQAIGKGLQFDCKHGEYFLFKTLELGLGGLYQEKNVLGVLATLDVLQKKGWIIKEEHIRKGFSQVVTLTGLKGRWQFLQQNPTVLCDTAHNEDGIKYIVQQLKTLSFEKLYVVLGFVKDKEIEKLLALLPKEGYYYFTKPSIPRALEAELLYEKAKICGLEGEFQPTVQEALSNAKKKATKNDLIYVGGSNFVVAEVV